METALGGGYRVYGEGEINLVSSNVDGAAIDGPCESAVFGLIQTQFAASVGIETERRLRRGHIHSVDSHHIHLPVAEDKSAVVGVATAIIAGIVILVILFVAGCK